VHSVISFFSLNFCSELMTIMCCVFVFRTGLAVADTRCAMFKSGDSSPPRQRGVSKHCVVAQHNSISPSRSRSQWSPAYIFRRPRALQVLAVVRRGADQPCPTGTARTGCQTAGRVCHSKYRLSAVVLSRHITNRATKMVSRVSTFRKFCLRTVICIILTVSLINVELILSDRSMHVAVTFYNILYVWIWYDWLHVVRLCYCTAACILLLFYFLHLFYYFVCFYVLLAYAGNKDGLDWISDGVIRWLLSTHSKGMKFKVTVTIISLLSGQKA